MAPLELHISGLSNYEFTLTVDDTMLGSELLKKVREQLPSKQASVISLIYRVSSLSLEETLRGQGLADHADLQYVYLPADMCSAWKGLRGIVEDQEPPDTPAPSELVNALERVRLPSSLQSLTFQNRFNQSIEGVNLPDNLEHLSFGFRFNQSLEHVNLPASLRSLTFGHNFNQDLLRVQFPAALETLAFGNDFAQSLVRVKLPSQLLHLTLGNDFNHSLEGVAWPALKTLILGHESGLCFGRPDFNQSLKDAAFPSSLEILKFGESFNQPLDAVHFPEGLQSLTFGSRFDQSLDDVKLPELLNELTFGHCFNQPMDKVKLPGKLVTLNFGRCFNQTLSGVNLGALESLTFGRDFDQSLEHVQLPDSLLSLCFGQSFNQTLESVSLPKSLQNLIFGSHFNQDLRYEGFCHSLIGVDFPSGLQSLTVKGMLSFVMRGVETDMNLPQRLQHLTFGFNFNQCLVDLNLPSTLESLTLGFHYNQSLEDVTLPSGLESLTFGQSFNQSLERVNFPEALAKLTFGHDFNQSLRHARLPKKLRALTFGHDFNQGIETLPEGLQSLTFGHNFDQPLAVSLGVKKNLARKMSAKGRYRSFPKGLQTLTFGTRFNQRLQGVNLPSELQSLTFGSCFDQSLEDGALRLSRREGEGEWTEELRYHSQDARACCNPVLEPGQTMSIGGIPSENWAILAMTKDAHLNPILSFRVSGDEADEDETRWSHQVPLSAVGDSVIALQRVDGESEPLLVRASIQLEGAMLFLVLSRGQWPFEIENRSSQHTVVFHQEGTDLDKEWVMRPREVRRFVFPDPEKPKTLQGRILGAGAELAVRYQLDNISAGGAQQELWIPGRSKAALLATLLLRGACRRLVLFDQESVGAETDGVIQADVVIQDQASVVTRMAFDVFFAGLHVCLADTLKSVPEELLAFTVDYIQLNKPSNERSLHLTVHHIQLDDFGDEDYFLLGPLDSGFNSRTLPLSDAEDFFAVPLLSLTLQGDRSTNMFDSLHRAITLKTFGVALRPMEARVDVPRLLYVAARLKGWTSSLDQQGLAADNIELLDRVLMTSFQMPSAGQTTCSVGLLQAQAISLNLELKLTQRQGDVKETSDFSGDADLAAQLRKQGSRFGALRPIIEFFGRLGASFADVAPRFRFSPLLITDASADLPVLQSAVARHYIQQLLQQSARLLGSLQLLGDPANLMDEIGSGVMSFFSKTKEEVLGQRAGLGSGVSDLTESIVGGALQSFAKMSGSLKDTVGSSLGQPIGSDRKALSLSEGLDLGYASIAVGLSEGISSVVKEPLKQANEDGLVGLASGTALGAASMVVRPLEGLLGAAEKIAQGAEGAVRGRFRGFCGLRRPPRAQFHQEATGLRPLAQSFFWPMPRFMPDPLTGMPCRDPEEESCNEVHATCAKVPKVGWSPDVKDPLSFVEPKGACELPVEKPPPLSGGGPGGALGNLNKDSWLQNAANAVGNAASMAQSLVGGGAQNSECNARMIDMPYGLDNPSAVEKSEFGADFAMLGGKTTMKAKLPITVWGQAVHGMSGTWAFDSGGLHSTDYVYKVEQSNGAPDDYYICDSRRRPQHCALLGGNVKQACAAWYDPRQCDFCVPIYPRDLLGELYRGEWKDVWMRPTFASVRLKKAGFQGKIKKLPMELVTTGPGNEALMGRGIAPPPFKFAEIAGLWLPWPSRGLRSCRSLNMIVDWMAERPRRARRLPLAVDEISLPSLWLERSVQSLVVYLRSSSGHHDMLRQEVHILRSHGWNTFGPVFQPATPAPALHHAALQPKGHVPQTVAVVLLVLLVTYLVLYGVLRWKLPADSPGRKRADRWLWCWSSLYDGQACCFYNMIFSPFVLTIHAIRIYLPSCLYAYCWRMYWILGGCCSSFYTDQEFPPQELKVTMTCASSDSSLGTVGGDSANAKSGKSGASTVTWVRAMDFCRQSGVQPHGQYHIKLFDPQVKQWTVIKLDDFVPCKPDSRDPLGVARARDGMPEALYAHPHGKETWVMMLEKAFAKLCGSYAATEAGITEPWLLSCCYRRSQEQPISSCCDDF
eukprot:s595_g6.t4